MDEKAAELAAATGLTVGVAAIGIAVLGVTITGSDRSNRACGERVRSSRTCSSGRGRGCNRRFSRSCNNRCYSIRSRLDI
uniref:Uncharacterized protein n=1 Tax=Daucus carota subsp. sativus TaxID=79200 RepID=A0A175YFP3_DAUCS